MRARTKNEIYFAIGAVFLIATAIGLFYQEYSLLMVSIISYLIIHSWVTSFIVVSLIEDEVLSDKLLIKYSHQIESLHNTVETNERLLFLLSQKSKLHDELLEANGITEEHLFKILEILDKGDFLVKNPGQDEK